MTLLSGKLKHCQTNFGCSFLKGASSSQRDERWGQTVAFVIFVFHSTTVISTLLDTDLEWFGDRWMVTMATCLSWGLLERFICRFGGQNRLNTNNGISCHRLEHGGHLRVFICFCPIRIRLHIFGSGPIWLQSLKQESAYMSAWFCLFVVQSWWLLDWACQTFNRFTAFET